MQHFSIQLLYMDSQTKGDAVYVSYPFIIKIVIVQHTADGNGNAFV